jgi:hypothetical protein
VPRAFLPFRFGVFDLSVDHAATVLGARPVYSNRLLGAVANPEPDAIPRALIPSAPRRRHSTFLP